VKKLGRTVLEGLFFTAAAAGALVASAHCGAGPSAGAIGAGTIGVSLLWDAATGALGSFTYKEGRDALHYVVDYLSRGGSNGDFPLNHDIARSVRLAQIRAVEAIAYRTVDRLKPNEADRSAQIAQDKLGRFMKGVLAWKRSAEEDVGAFELWSSDDVANAGADARALFGAPDATEGPLNIAEVWAKSGVLTLDELEKYSVSGRPPLFDEMLSGRAEIEDVTWANAVTAFFLETLKTDTATYRILSIDLLREIGIGTSRLQFQLAETGKEALSAIQDSLGPIGQALSRIDRQLAELAGNDREHSAKLNRILALLASASEEEADARLQRWAGSEYADPGLTAHDVRELVAEHKLFVGRTHDFEVLDGFLNEHDRGLLIVTGPPGVGKTAFLVEWIARRRELGDFVARHLIARRAPTTIESIAVLEHLLRQIGAYRGARRETVPDGESKLASAIFEHLKAPACRSERLIVVIDGLDEADPKLVSFVRQEIGAGVFVVVGVRAEPSSEPEVLKRWLSFGLGSLPRARHDLGTLTVEEVVQWLRLSMPSIRLLSEAEIALALNRISDGVPLYLRFLIDDFVRAVSDLGLEKARDVLTKMPPSFSDNVQAELGELNRLDDPAWGSAARKLFALLTQVRGPISAREMGRGGLVAPELLYPGRLDHRLERWFSIVEHGSERTFAFAHPHLAKVFGEVLDYEAEDAQAQLCTYCRSWGQHHGAYALAYAPDHLISAASASGWPPTAVAEAAAPLLSADFHCQRLQLPISDGLLASARRQLRALAKRAEPPLAEKLQIVAGALAEAGPMVSINTLPHRDEAVRLLSVLMADFAADLSVAVARSGLMRLRSPPRARPSAYFLSSREGDAGWVTGAQELADGRILSCGGGGHLRLWDAEGAPLAVLEGYEGNVYGASELRDGHLLSWGFDLGLRLWRADGSPLAALEPRKYVHDLPVYSLGVCVLADGRLLSWRIDHELQLWSSDGTPLAVLEGHRGKVKGALELTDGNLLSWGDSSDFWGGYLGYVIDHSKPEDLSSAMEGFARLVATSDSSLRLWTRDGEELALLKRHLPPQAPLKLDRKKTFTPPDITPEQIQASTPEQIEEARALLKDGIPGWDFHSMVMGAMELRSRNILSWGDGPLRLWSADGAPIATLEGHYGGVFGARELSNGRILSWDAEGGLRLWTEEGVPIASLEFHTKVLGGLALTDGRLLSWGTSAKRWRRPRGDGIRLGPRGACSSRWPIAVVEPQREAGPLERRWREHRDGRGPHRCSCRRARPRRGRVPVLGRRRRTYPVE
jgi:WD40 repeat protein